MKSTHEPKIAMLEEAIEELKKAQEPLNLCLDSNEIGEAGAGFLAEAIKVTKVPMNLCLDDNEIGGAGAVFIAEAIK